MIAVNRDEFAAAQKALIEVLQKEYAIINQSPAKIENLTARILLHKNHHALKSTFKESEIPNDTIRSRLRNMLRRECGDIRVGGESLSNYRKCENCNHIDSAGDMLPAKNLTQRIGDGDDYSDLECPHCGALTYSVDHCIDKGDFDFILFRKDDGTGEFGAADFCDMSDYYMAEYSGNGDESDLADALRLLLIRADYFAYKWVKEIKSPLGYVMGQVVLSFTRPSMLELTIESVKELIEVNAVILEEESNIEPEKFLFDCFSAHRVMKEAKII